MSHVVEAFQKVMFTTETLEVATKDHRGKTHDSCHSNNLICRWKRSLSRSFPPATRGNTSRSGTVFAASRFATAHKVDLQSKSGQPLGRYFPELVEALGKLKAKQFVIDGEIVVPVKGKFSFDDLLMRIHPAASRIKKLAEETPSKLIVFDLLVDDRGKSLVDLAL